MRIAAVALACLALSGCLGYRIGSAQPHYLADIHSIAVPMFKNSTLTPRVEALVTGTVVKQFQQDGTYQIVSEDKADATLEGEIYQIARSPARSVQGNVLSTAEFNLFVRVRYTLVNHKTGLPFNAPMIVAGQTNFFVGSDVTTDERQALPLAAEELAIRLVSQLSEGF